MRFRCPNDLFSYCTDKPIPGRGQTKVTFLGSGEQQAALPCKLSPKTCRREKSSQSKMKHPKGTHRSHVSGKRFTRSASRRGIWDKLRGRAEHLNSRLVK